MGPDDRLVPDGIGAAADENDCSLEEIGGVLIRPGSCVASFFTGASRGMSWISTRSSSPSLLVRPFVLGGEGALPVVWAHLPFGSITT